VLTTNELIEKVKEKGIKVSPNTLLSYRRAGILTSVCTGRRQGKFTEYDESAVEEVVEAKKFFRRRGMELVEPFWGRQCQVCLNATSKYDQDTGHYDNGCIEENNPKVEKAYELMILCPQWKPYPYPCEFKRPGCEVYWEAAK
jgi:hypothetical protein